MLLTLDQGWMMTRYFRILAMLMTLATGSAWSIAATAQAAQTDDKVYR